MEKKTKRRLSPTVCCVLLCAGLITVLNVCAPAREFSARENRYLAQLPACSLRKLFLDEDKWTLDFETYMTDQFALRDLWIALKAGCERAAGKTENNGVYFAGEQNLIAAPTPYDEETARVNCAAIDKFAAASPTPVYVAFIPNSLYVNRALLPRYAPDGGQAAIIEACRTQLGVPAVSLLPAMEAHRGEPLYYRTDHHATSLGAYYLYAALGETLGYAPLPIDAYRRETVSDSFRGTTAAKSGAWWVGDDTIELFHGPGETSRLYTYEDAETESGLYALDRLQTADQYTVFLGGNHPRQVIKTGAAGKKLLLLKDSFAHSIAPFLCAHYSEIHLLDLRYYRRSVLDYAAENGIDETLILYSVNNFVTERNLLFLGG